MAQSKKIKLALVSLLTLNGILTCINSAFAQITPDGTLPINSKINIQGNIRNITEGTSAGGNLFHSFSEFSVPNNSTVYFRNADNIQNIITRVTGGSISNIDGLIKADGQANLFLINPNGIVFGQGARLDIGGSFIGSTANSLKFADGTEFSATLPQNKPLLTVSVPIGLQYGGSTGSIINQSQVINRENVGLAVSPGKTIALVGGDVSFNGGKITAREGRIELGSVAVNGLVRLTPTNDGYTLGYEDVPNFGNIKLSQRSVVDASGNSGGNIQVQGKLVEIANGSQIAAKTLGLGTGGNLSVNASEGVVVSGESTNPIDFSRLTTRTEGGGNAGEMKITAPKLIIEKGAQVSSGNYGRQSTGNGGTLTVKAANSVVVSGVSANGEVVSRLTTRTEGVGTAGEMKITSPELVIEKGAEISTGTSPGSRGNGGNLTVSAANSVIVSGTSTDGKELSRLTTRTQGGGNAGDMTINANSLIIQDGGRVSTGSTFNSAGAGGNLSVYASDSIKVVGGSGYIEDNRSQLATQIGGDKPAGKMTLNTSKLLIEDGGQVLAGSNSESKGAGGSLTINASEFVKVTGFILTPDNTAAIPSRLTTRTEGSGNAGNMTINTNSLVIEKGGQVSAGVTFKSTGNGGNLTVNAPNSVEVRGFITIQTGFIASRLTNRTENDGFTGDLKITTGELIIQNSAEVGVNSTLGSQKAGNLEIVASSILLDNKATLNARARSVEGGNIMLQVQDLLLLRRNSQISATAGITQDAGNGGNITINSPDGFVVAVPDENNDIAANAYTGRGGRVEITAQGIFGLTARSLTELETLLLTKDPDKLNPARLPSSDITAISRTNPSLSGVVTTNTLGIDPSRELVNLPIEPVDTQIAQGCQVDADVAQSEFIITGRGGLPPGINEAIEEDAVAVDLVTTKPEQNNISSLSNNTQKVSSTPKEIVEAQGWVVTKNGQVILTATAPSVTPDSFWQTPIKCSK
ncbi:MAG: filamentous hemagglutinin N-terminal domain-containing protein [Scytonematopsis contorta HA4267-MV1]|jgi:filamentous hemagglutinin family protein|nr:filamentous hemagglutinin N-terminal domain-containing protein [Scytonematopsis contorta HA4267-MV1]